CPGRMGLLASPRAEGASGESRPPDAPASFCVEQVRGQPLHILLIPPLSLNDHRARQFVQMLLEEPPVLVLTAHDVAQPENQEQVPVDAPGRSVAQVSPVSGSPILRR